MKYGKELRCLNTEGKYGQVTKTWMKQSIISKSVMTVIFVEFIDLLIDYPINRASFTVNVYGRAHHGPVCGYRVLASNRHRDFCFVLS